MKLRLQYVFTLNLMLVFSMYSTSIKQLSIPMFIEKYSSVNCIQCTEKHPFNMTPFPLYPEFINNFPAQGHFKPVFILQIPDGIALFSHDYYSGLNYVFFNNCFIKETQIKYFNWFNGDEFEIEDISNNVKKVQGRVAILSHHVPDCYGHWIFDILGQLAMLEIHHIEYDYLCVPYYTKFMKETLEIWGIDSSKIIPLTHQAGIQADSIIMVTPVTQIEALVAANVNYSMDFILKYIRNKLLSGVNSIHEPTTFSNKIFISRKNASRFVPNEDEIFALFEARGFQRYELTEMSIVQQIQLFYNAQTIVSFVGSGSTNIIFCRPGTHYIEIVQKTVDATFFYVADIFKLQYSYIDNSTFHDLVNGHQFTPATTFPISLVEDFLRQHLNS